RPMRSRRCGMPEFCRDNKRGHCGHEPTSRIPRLAAPPTQASRRPQRVFPSPIRRPRHMALIVDLTRLSGAYATRLLAEAGNRVVRVETAGGDDVRRAAPFIREVFDLEHGACHQFLNAGKESVTLDPATQDGAEVLQALLRIATCAIVTRPFCRDAAWFFEA